VKSKGSQLSKRPDSLWGQGRRISWA